ncbi:hypothetical protein AMTRI_Chr12g274640 [Amborella trichopoda]
MLTTHYIQHGLIFGKPHLSLHSVLDAVKASLADCLSHFFSLARRLATDANGLIYIHCNDAGTHFIHARATHLTIDDVVSTPYVSQAVKSFFSLDFVISYEGHGLPLLVVQVTELADGLFIGCSLNHTAGDGTTFSNFLNSWAEKMRGEGSSKQISQPPVMEPWFPGHLPIALNLSEANLERYTQPLLLEKFIHFSAQDVELLKFRANKCQDQERSWQISSLQALAAHLWRAVTRARGLLPD